MGLSSHLRLRSALYRAKGFARWRDRPQRVTVAVLGACTNSTCHQPTAWLGRSSRGRLPQGCDSIAQRRRSLGVCVLLGQWPARSAHRSGRALVCTSASAQRSLCERHGSTRLGSVCNVARLYPPRHGARYDRSRHRTTKDRSSARCPRIETGVCRESPAGQRRLSVV